MFLHFLILTFRHSSYRLCLSKLEKVEPFNFTEQTQREKQQQLIWPNLFLGVLTVLVYKFFRIYIEDFFII